MSLLARLALPAAALASTAQLASAQKYVVEDLPPISSFGGRAFDVNNVGRTVGSGLSPTLQVHGLVWNGSAVVDLTPANPLAEAHGISEGGLVAGWMQNPAGTTEAVRWIGGAPSFLGMLPGHVGSLAQDVNDDGLVAGWSVTSVGDPVASVWIDGQIQAIAGAHSWAFAVSETGDVVGRQWVGVDIEAFRWRDGVFTVLPDLGPNHASAVGASPKGLIAGGAQSPVTGALHAVVWAPDLSLTDLGHFPGGFSAQAYDVNDAGVAVGVAVIDPVGEVMWAMVWRGGPAEDLNTLIQPGTGWTLFEARAVNDRGEIVGIGLKSFGGVRPFRLRPDCDEDAISDIDEIAAGTAHDANGDDLADACQHCQTDLGFQGPGAVELSLCGDPLTEAGSAATLEIAQVPPGSPLFLAVGAASSPTPLFGGVLVPVPPTVVLSGMVAGASGGLAMTVHGSAAPAATLYLQAVALVGFEAQFSNALSVEIGLP